MEPRSQPCILRRASHLAKFEDHRRVASVNLLECVIFPQSNGKIIRLEAKGPVTPVESPPSLGRGRLRLVRIAYRGCTRARRSRTVEVNKNRRAHFILAVEIRWYPRYGYTMLAQDLGCRVRHDRRPIPFAGRAEIAMMLRKARATRGAPFMSGRNQHVVADGVGGQQQREDHQPPEAPPPPKLPPPPENPPPKSPPPPLLNPDDATPPRNPPLPQNQKCFMSVLACFDPSRSTR